MAGLIVLAFLSVALCVFATFSALRILDAQLDRADEAWQTGGVSQ